MKQEILERFRKDLRILELLLADLAKSSAFNYGVSISQFHIIHCLIELKSCSMVELTEELSMEKSKVSRVIDQLVKLGYVNRENNPDNRRYSIVSLTASGKQLAKNLNKSHNDFFSKALKKLPATQLNHFIDGFDQFIETLQNECEKPG